VGIWNFQAACWLFGIKEVGLFKFKQCWIVLIKPFKDLSHDGFPHEFGFIPDTVFFAIEIDGLLLPVIEQNGGPFNPSQLVIFLLIHLAIIGLVLLKIEKALR